MLGVLKRRWKPKRASNGNRLSDSLPPEYLIGEKSRCVPVPCVRQVHPTCEERTHVAYDEQMLEQHNNVHNCVNLTHSLPVYPLTPNICVEAGRIEFIKTAADGSDTRIPCTLEDTQKSCEHEDSTTCKVMISRAQQTTEKYATVQESLEAKIEELEKALEAAKTTELRDKQALAKLQKQLSKKESCAHDVERERRLRAESEARVREAAADAARCRTRIKVLSMEFSRMEETVRALIMYKSHLEHLHLEKQSLAVAFENRVQQYQSTIDVLNAEITSLRQQLQAFPPPILPESRLAVLEANNVALCQDAEDTRRQYESCLDDIANQVVRALLSQKNLKEEISSLNHRIKELESHNRTLITVLCHHFYNENRSNIDLNMKSQFVLETSASNKEFTINNFNKTDISDVAINRNCDIFKESKILSEHNDRDLKMDKIITNISDKQLSADSEIFETRLSIEDKKRHHILTKLWTELKGNTEVSHQKLLESLSTIDSSRWVPPQRPISLNLQFPIFQSSKSHLNSKSILDQSTNTNQENTGNKTPESGSRDEGYFTMSSDIQEVNTVSSDACVLEDLKEATDESDLPETKIIFVEDQYNPDILYIPLNISLGVNPRNSFPPSKSSFPFQHIMRSFSDSHLSLKITSSSPCYSLSSPISSSPSIFLLDISDKCINPLRRSKATTLISSVDYSDEETNSNDYEYTSWDTEYAQQWLKLDESRSMLQHQRDCLELEYDHTELEDWSLNLSSEDVQEIIWRKNSEIMTPGQYSLSTLPSIQENNALELEEDSNECLWNSSSYMADKVGGELVALLMDNSEHIESEKKWPYAMKGNQSITFPDDSWSSGETNSEYSFHTYDQESFSKRSSAALSGCSDDFNESHPVGTDFTRDFYRLVKFESTKSLASISSKNATDQSEREQVLQNVLTFIAEQQLYCNAKEEYNSRTSSSLRDEQIKDFNIEAPSQNMEQIITVNNESEVNCCDSVKLYNDNYVNIKQLRTEFALNKHNLNKVHQSEDVSECIIINTMIYDDTSYIDNMVNNCSSVESYSLVDPETNNDSYNCVSDNRHIDKLFKTSISNDSFINTSHAKPLELNTSTSELTKQEHVFSSNGLPKCQTSSNSIPNITVSRIPRRQIFRSSIPSLAVSPSHSKKIPQPIQQTKHTMKFRLPAKDQRNVKVKCELTDSETINELPQYTSELLVNNSSHEATGFYEQATSKNVINELNRIIRIEEENDMLQETENIKKNAKIDKDCLSTSWIHFEKAVDLNKPKKRTNFIDVMMATNDSSPNSSCDGSVSNESTDDPPDYGHLHRIHRFNRQKKASAIRLHHAVLRWTPAVQRPCIIGRDNFFVRFGEKEKEAVSSFDFLDEFSTGSLTSSIDEEVTEILNEESTVI